MKKSHLISLTLASLFSFSSVFSQWNGGYPADMVEPRKVTIGSTAKLQGVSFYAIKSDDVNGSPTSERTTEIITTDEQWLTAGEVFTVSIQVPDHLMGVHFTLLHPKLSFIPDPKLSHVAHSLDQEHTNVLAFQADLNSLTFQFRALADGWLSESLSLIYGLGIDAADQTSALGLEFTASGACGPECFTNDQQLIASPNPFGAGTILSLQLDRAQEIDVVIYDAHSRAVYRTSQKGNVGLNRLWIDGAYLPKAGIYTCVVHLQNRILTNRVIKI